MKFDLQDRKKSSCQSLRTHKPRCHSTLKGTRPLESWVFSAVGADTQSGGGHKAITFTCVSLLSHWKAVRTKATNRTETQEFHLTAPKVKNAMWYRNSCKVRKMQLEFKKRQIKIALLGVLYVWEVLLSTTTNIILFTVTKMIYTTVMFLRFYLTLYCSGSAFCVSLSVSSCLSMWLTNCSQIVNFTSEGVFTWQL